MKLLERLLGRSEPAKPAVKDVTIFAQDREWTRSALHTGDATRALPKGLIEQADKSLKLRGALAEFVQQNKPTVQKVQSLTDATLHQQMNQKYPNEHFAKVQLTTSFAVYTVVVVGVSGRRGTSVG